MENNTQTEKPHVVSWIKVVGTILLIVGTTIGGGMLALPVGTATMGFTASFFYLIVIWALMTVGALLILEVNAWLPFGNNLISMAGATVGRVGQVLAWIFYLVLLYCLLSAYVAGGQEVVSTLFSYLHLHLSGAWAAVIFLLIFSLIVYSGLQSVDWANRFIMAIKLLSYFAMVIFALPLAHPLQLVEKTVHFGITSVTLMLIVTSFGFSIIVPSLRIYFRDNIKLLRRALIIGCFVPLLFYVIWEGVIFSVLPRTGPYSLQALAHSPQPVAKLMEVLSHVSESSSIIFVANVFTSVCVITAFLGAALCLIDFLADGLALRKQGVSGLFLYLLTFLPPLLLALFAQKVFILGLSYAGIPCVFLLILLPAWMVWRGRYKHNFEHTYRVFGGRILLAGLFIISLGLLFLGAFGKLLSI